MEPSVSTIEDFLNCNSFSKPSREVLSSIILSKTVQLSIQLRALYFCRDLPIRDATELLLSALDLHYDVFLRHEIAYVLGQAGCIDAAKKLSMILDDPLEDPMVRHEAAEALGALGDKNYIELIKKYSDDACIAVRDTCLLALHSINNTEKANNYNVDCTSFPISLSPYRAIDPISLRSEINDKMSLDSLSKILLDETLPLYKRYESLYAIRGMSSDESAKIIGEALINDRSSEVFRHECAFVLGQMQSSASVDALIKCLNNVYEEPMARHEAALALGSCATVCSDNEYRNLITDVLKRFVHDPVKVVSDSCIVALDNVIEI